MGKYHENINTTDPEITIEREMHRHYAEHQEDEGWKVVRAKKKRSSGSGYHSPRQTRPGREGVKAVDSGVSNSYWAQQPPMAGQVVLDGGQSGPIPRHLEPNNPSTQSVSGPAISGSSADHTPFPNRISILARDLRLRQVGRLGRPILTKDVSLSGPKAGPDNTLSSPIKEKAGPSDMDRPKDTFMEKNTDLDMAGNFEDNDDALSDCNDPIGGSTEMENTEMNGAQEIGNREKVYKITSALYEMGSPNMQSEEHEMETANGPRITGGERKKTDKGRGMAEYIIF